MDPDSNTDVANTPNDQLVSILNRLSMLEQQLEQSEEKTERIELLVKTQESQIIHMQKRNAELENKFKIEKKYRQLNDNFVILKNQIQRLEEIVASIKTKSNGSENNNNPEDVDKEDKETNSRILAIKNAGEYTISQIRKLRKDYLKEECKIDLAFQALYKAEKEALGVIKKEKQVLEEAKNIRKKEINEIVVSGIQEINDISSKLMRELGYSVECALQDLEKMNFDLITQQKQSLYNLGNGIYGINGTYTTYQLIHMVESLPEPQRSRKNKNKTKGKAQSSKFPIVDPGYDNGNWIRVYDPRLTRPMVLGDYLVKWSNMGITAMTD